MQALVVTKVDEVFHAKVFNQFGKCLKIKMHDYIWKKITSLSIIKTRTKFPFGPTRAQKGYNNYYYTNPIVYRL